MTPFIVGIAGGTGSGKTTIVRQLVERLGDERVVVIDHDSYYHSNRGLSPEECRHLNYDHPDSLETGLLIEHLQQLRACSAVDVPIYDFCRHRRLDECRRVEPRPVIIVEGILVLTERPLRACFDLCIFVSTDDDVRLIRRLQRDRIERARSTDSVIEQYLSTVKPMHERFVRPSQFYADLIVQGGREIERAVEVLAARLAVRLDSADETLLDRG